MECKNNGNIYSWHLLLRHMLFAGQEVRIGKNCARGLKTEGTVFPNTDRPKPVITFLFFSSVEYFVKAVFVLIFYCSHFQTWCTRAFDI